MPSALTGCTSTMRSYRTGKTRMREGKENEGLAFQTRLEKALKAKLTTNKFILQSK